MCEVLSECVLLLGAFHVKDPSLRSVLGTKCKFAETVHNTCLYPPPPTEDFTPTKTAPSETLKTSP